MKKIGFFALVCTMLLSFLSFAPSADAATTYKGTFEGFTYAQLTEEQQKNGEQPQVNGVTVRNSAGKTNTFRVTGATYYYINNTKTTIAGFKYGMPVEVTMTLNRVQELRGTSVIDEGTIGEKSKEVYGKVTMIDPNGMFIRVKPDTGKEREYYVNSDTAYFKGKTSVDLSILYEGDRVKMYFSATDTSTIEKMDIIQTGTRIENLYKAQLRSVNVTGKRFTVVNSQPFVDWEFGTSHNKNMKTFTFSNSTSIYVGNKQITRNQLRNYTDSDIYYVTVSQFSKEIVNKIIVLQNNERTYFDELTLVNPTAKYIRLKDIGTLYYHNGSILVRNGRLVEGSSLAASGSAFVLTDGATKSATTHIINVMSDGFLSANLASHDLYFGKLSLVDDRKYALELTDFTQLQKEGQYRNFWRATKENELVLSYSNDTVASTIVGQSGTALTTALGIHKGKYGYFYVKDGHVQAIHLVQKDAIEPSQIFTGTIAELTIREGTPGAKGIDATAQMVVKNVAQWTDGGSWLETGRLEDLEVYQTLILKKNKRIGANQLAVNDRIVLFTDEQLKTRIILVNE